MLIILWILYIFVGFSMFGVVINFLLHEGKKIQQDEFKIFKYYLQKDLNSLNK